MKKANVYSGEFQVFDPVAISGNSKNITDAKSSSYSLSVNHGNSKTVTLNGLRNEGYDDDGGDGYLKMPDSMADINYRIVQTNFNINLNRLYKSNSFYYGAYVGAGPFPYISPTIGYNAKNLEVGTSVVIGYYANKVNCNGHRISEMWDGSDKSEDFTISEYYWHQYHSLNIFSNLYISGVYLNYSGAIAYPYGIFQSLEGYDLSFRFPYIFKNSVGFGYNIGSAFVKIGLSQTMDGEFIEKLYSANVQFGAYI